MNIRVRMAVLSLAVFMGITAAQDDPVLVTVGSKKFTESVVLGEIVRGLAEAGGAEAVHRRELGGSRILFNALKRGDLDVYPEYTGTLRLELLAEMDLEDDRSLPSALEKMGLRMSAPLGFNNTYAIGVLERTAGELGLRTIGDLAGHPRLQLAFTNEFIDRSDGWPGLKRAYSLPQTARGIDHDLAYRALETGEIGATDLYSTDAEIAYYGLTVLEDDRGYFPRYDAVLLYRADLETRAPWVLRSILRLPGSLDEARMSALNRSVKIGGTDDAGNLTRINEAEASARFLRETFNESVAAPKSGLVARLMRTTREHLWLVGAGMFCAIVIGVPLGVASARIGRLGAIVLGGVGILQTIPALALLVVLIKPFGLTATTAIAALFLYSLLPIVRNTHAGMTGISRELIESADALGMSDWSRLCMVELPLALPTLLAGVKTASVICIGTATLAALIGAGGYGQPILTGIRLDDFGLILEGAVPSALMALGAQVVFGLVERAFVSEGLRGS